MSAKCGVFLCGLSSQTMHEGLWHDSGAAHPYTATRGPGRKMLIARVDHERELGRPFSEAWEMALETVEDRYDRQVLHDTRTHWQDGCERRQSKMRALA